MRFSMLTKVRDNPAYAGARLGADRMASRFGASVEHLIASGADPAGMQAAMLEAALGDPPDAILLHAFADPRIDRLIGRVGHAGIPLVLIVNRPAGAGCDVFVGSDDHLLAREAATHLCLQVRVGGRVAILDGSANALGAPARGRGFREALARCPGIGFAGAAAGDYDRGTSRTALTALLRRGGPIHGVLAANDLSALGAIDALGDEGIDAAVVGINATPDGIAAVKSGRLLATSAFDAMAMACLGAEAAVRVLRGEAVPREIMLPVQLVTAANLAGWDKPYEKRASPDWDSVMASLPHGLPA